MPTYVVERTFTDGFPLMTDARGAVECSAAVERNSDHDVTWVHSYVSSDRRKSFCIYDAPNPEAIRQTAARNGLPVDRITPVRVLDPYFYH